MNRSMRVSACCCGCPFEKYSVGEGVEGGGRRGWGMYKTPPPPLPPRLKTFTQGTSFGRKKQKETRGGGGERGGREGEKGRGGGSDLQPETRCA